MIDTHCHIFLKQFRDDLEEVLQRSESAGITHLFMPAIDFGSLEAMNELQHPSIQFHKMAGIHPTQVDGTQSGVEETLRNYCSRDEVIAVGETGLDYYWSTQHKPLQKELLKIHCRVARELNKPVILHNRDSTGDLLDIIEEEQDGSLKGIWHCFNGSPEEGRRAINLGLHLGIGGLVTFKNANVDRSVAELPLEKMVVETDAPYLAPEPHRGERNEPSFVVHTARKLAEIFEKPLDQIESITDRAALSLFNVKA